MAYGIGVSTVNNIATGNNNIDSLVGYKRWASKNITFSFTNNFRNDYEDESGYPDNGLHNATFSSLNAIQRAATREWMAMYESVSGLNLIELTGANDRHATIRMAESSHPSTAYAYLPHTHVAGGDIWFNKTNYNTPIKGNYAYHTFGHEIGHALGLTHGHEGIGSIRNVSTNANRDSMEFSIMTYNSYIGDNGGGYGNETYGFAQSLMMYDIRAIQEMYGANFNYNATNTNYTFSPTTGQMFVNGVGQGNPGANRIFRTIWDGNGIDTYNFANYKTNLSISLLPGHWSDLDVGDNAQRAYLGGGHYARGHVFNALQFKGDVRSLIENAYGGSGHDRIYGNGAKNSLVGHAGNDVLHGFGGNDRLWGSGGHDYLLGGSGHDVIVGGLGNDRINGTAHAFQGTGERDILISGSLSDRDTFILGDNKGVYYNDYGNADFAVIKDFDVYDFLGDIADRIQLLGSAVSYSLSNVSVNGIAGAGIHYAGDLIGIVQGINSASLDLTNSNQFMYV